MDFSFNIIFLVLFHIFIALAINRDCSARCIKKKNSYTVCAFFFPVIAGIVYACTRNKAQTLDEKAENREKLLKNSKIFFVSALIFFVISLYAGTDAMSNADSFSITTYNIVSYDRTGTPYFFRQKINYFDRSGNTYKLSEDENNFVNINTGEEYSVTNCFVDKDGYLVYFTSEDISDMEMEESIYTDNKNHHSYMWAKSARWDKDGGLYNAAGRRWYLV